MNLKLLKSKLVLNGLTVKNLHQKLTESGLIISDVTLYRKLSGKVDFQRKEIQYISEVLSLTKEEINEIFFN